MTKGQRIGLGIGITLVVLLLLYTSRAFWVALVKAKWSKRFPFLKGQDYTEGTTLFTGVTARQWNSYTMAELRSAYFKGMPYWFADGSAEQLAATKANRTGYSFTKGNGG